MIALRPRLGLGIGCQRLSAVLLDGGTVKWTASIDRDEEEPFRKTVARLLDACPRSRLRPPVVIGAIGPAAAQLKLIVDLPPLAEPGAIAALVREQASRFFLKNGVPLVFSGARVTSPTSAWIAAFEEPMVREIAVACRSARLALHAVAPTAVALHFATLSATVAWRDGDVELAVSYANGAPNGVRTSVARWAPVEAPKSARDSESVKELDAGLLDAAGAARLPRREPIMLGGKALRLTEVPSRRRVAIALTICAIAIAIALLAPIGAAMRVEHSARARNAAVNATVRRAERYAKELAAATEALGAIASFSQSRRSLTLLLAELTRALPNGSALIAVQIDSTGGGNVVAIGPHAAAVVDAVERVPGFASPEIVGPVTRETVGGHLLDRVTVRFRLVPEGVQ